MLMGMSADLYDVIHKADEGKGEEIALDYIHTALDIDLQRQYRDANRPDKPKTQSATAKFKQLSPEKQKELLRPHQSWWQRSTCLSWL
jgi:hypothetical protein